jgi:hypothetical protein
MKKETTKKKLRIRIQPLQRADGILPYPFFILESGHIERQDFWKGKPKSLIGFSVKSTPGYVKGSITLMMFLKDPKRAIGMFPIFEHDDSNWFTYEDAIESIKLI